MSSWNARPNAKIVALAWLVRDTFRQSVHSGVCWILLGITLVSTAFCLSVGIHDAPVLDASQGFAEFLPSSDLDAPRGAEEGLTLLRGELTIAFGAWHIPLGRDARDAVRFLQLLLAGAVADTLGLLLALVWTAGFLPSFLEERSIAVLLAKPLSRRWLLCGKYLGVLAFVLAHALLFVGLTWLALGARTGVWNGAYWWCVPMLLVHFAVFFGFSLLVATATRNATACVFGSILFWALCWGVNFGRHAVVASVYEETGVALSSTMINLVDGCYWVLPKPADFGILLADALEAGEAMSKLREFSQVQQRGDFHPLASIACSLLFLAGLLGLSVHQFESLEY